MLAPATASATVRWDKMKPTVSIITPVKARNAQHVEWLDEAIASVQGQTVDVWEMIVANDHSEADLSALKAKWHNITWLDSQEHGVSAARNTAAAAAQGILLLPLDADDKLSENAVEVFLQAGMTRGDARIIYSDIVMFGQDYSRVYIAPGYDFEILLKGTFMTVGCLHLKEDWVRVGGWRSDMQLGLEDWEYWLAMGEIGVCGMRVSEPLYYYRRHTAGRLANLKSNQENWNTAYQRMRDLHQDSYNGRWPVGCCGKAAQSTATARRPSAQQVLALSPDRVAVVYTGNKAGGFWVSGPVTHVKYSVPGIGMMLEDGNGKVGVDPRDVETLVSIRQGLDFKRITLPKPTAPPAPMKPSPARTNTAFNPKVMEDTQPKLTPAPKPEPEPEEGSMLPNVAALSVRALRDLALTPGQAEMMLEIEKQGKNRSTVITHLERIASG